MANPISTAPAAPATGPTPIQATPQQLEVLEEHGAHFVFCYGTTRRRCDPKRAFQEGWEHKKPSMEEVVQHIKAGGWLGIIPRSVWLAAIDIDYGDSPARRDRLDTHLGTPSLASVRTGKGTHLLYAAFYEKDRDWGNSKWALNADSTLFKPPRKIDDSTMPPDSCAGDIRAEKGYCILWDPTPWVEAAERAAEREEGIDLAPLQLKGSEATPAPMRSDTPQAPQNGHSGAAHTNLNGYPIWTTELIEGFLAHVTACQPMDDWVGMIKSLYEAAVHEAGWAHHDAVDRLDAWSRQSEQYREADRPERVLGANGVNATGTNGKGLTAWAKRLGAAYPRAAASENGTEIIEDDRMPEEVLDTSDNTEEAPKRESRANRFRRLTEQIVEDNSTEFMFVEFDTYVSDPRGLWHPVESKGGAVQICRMLEDAEQSAMVTGRDVKDVAATLQARQRGITEVEPSNLNGRMLLLGRDATFDALSRREMTPNEVRPAYCTYRPPGAFQLHGERDNGLLEQLQDYYGEELRPTRYLMRHRMQREKRVPLLWGMESDLGKSMAVKVNQLLWGDTREITQSAFNSDFDTGLISLSKYTEVYLDEANTERLNPAKINALTAGGEIEVNPKGKEAITIQLRGSFVLLAGGLLGETDKDGEFTPFPWGAQGILPDQEGRGGRFRDAYHFTNQPIPRRYGRWIYLPQDAQEAAARQRLINTLGHWLLTLDEIWPEAWNDQARADLNEFVQLHGNDVSATGEPVTWQSMLGEVLEKKEGASVDRTDIEAALINANRDLPLPPASGNALQRAMLRTFGTKATTVKKKSVYLGIGVKQ